MAHKAVVIRDLNPFYSIGLLRENSPVLIVIVKAGTPYAVLIDYAGQVVRIIGVFIEVSLCRGVWICHRCEIPLSVIGINKLV